VLRRVIAKIDLAGALTSRIDLIEAATALSVQDQRLLVEHFQTEDAAASF